MLNMIPYPQHINVLDQNQRCSFCHPVENIRLLMEIEDQRIVMHTKKQFQHASIQLQSVQNGYYLVTGAAEEVVTTDVLEQLKEKHEGYYLRISPDHLMIYSPTARGLFYGIQSYKQMLNNHDGLPSLELMDWPDIDVRCMNYDFRVIYPKFDKLIEYLEDMAYYKANSILIEYEDKFPFTAFPELHHEEYVFSKQEFQTLIQTAHENYIDIIPLQQSFGHLEYVLKHERYKHLRMTSEDIGELDPHHEESFQLACRLIREIAVAHPNSSFIHLGCDEVWSLNRLPEGTKEQVFIEYVNKLIDYVVGLGKTPIIWHDMLAKCSDQELARLDTRAVVMIWRYDGKNIVSEVTAWTEQFRRFDIELWGGPSARCWDKQDDQNTPKTMNRISNLRQWVDVSLKQNINALVCTNWAAVFGMGVPYGPFETSWYTMGYALDVFWNAHADQDGYINRFLKVYHDLESEQVHAVVGNYDIEDYYDIASALADQINRNHEVAILIKALKEFENATDKTRTIHKFVYRWSLYPDQEAEKRSLKAKHQMTQQLVEQSRERLNEILPVFFSPSMAQHFILSRYHIYDFLEKELYANLSFTK